MSYNTELLGPDKAAIFLLALGPKLSAPILQKMDDEGLVELAKRMPNLSEINSETLAHIYQEYAQIHRSGHPFIGSSAAEVRELLHGVVDDERLQRIMESLQDGLRSEPPCGRSSHA